MNSPEQSQYTVVARRYRPQSFTDLVGQGHIAQALSNAIRQNRVGHAYLFTGARGVGKTSSARIFAKCLNCDQGPTITPCNDCDICQTVSLGEDVDVLEFDGASNRGIEEIRQLRANANVRPSRSRYKIYIIDEVHMLTREAFNALLKTLEEPPEHVKFIFCTTDPQKIPVTVLSRCQRFDFSPVQTTEITQRLEEICANEQIEADPSALALLARRASGSMRDSQSLLEQLFSFCDDKLTIDDVNQLLGTADMGRVSDLASSMAAGHSGECLGKISAAIQSGVEVGQLAQQTLGYFRDMMAIQVGASPDILLSCSENDTEQLQQQGHELGLETILSIVQILDQTVVRMQSSLHTRALLEVAVVRICNLEHLDLLADLANQLGQSKTAPPAPARANAGQAAKKNGTLDDLTQTASRPPSASDAPSARQAQPEATQKPAPPKPASPVARPAAGQDTEASGNAGQTASETRQEPVASSPAMPINKGNLEQVWQKTIENCGDMTSDMASQYRKLELPQPNQLVVTFKDKYTSDMCSRPERKQKLEAALHKTTGQSIRIDFAANMESKQEPVQPHMSRVQRIRELEKNPLVQSALEIFDGEVVDFQLPGKKN
ncbi:MAG: DNA polymerase III subunit gamma/tau [Mariniblastus sp.]|nr:DNA polymerase III subunit gamma/tau [Mariniblastus sp.]